MSFAIPPLEPDVGARPPPETSSRLSELQWLSQGGDLLDHLRRLDLRPLSSCPLSPPLDATSTMSVTSSEIEHTSESCGPAPAAAFECKNCSAVFPSHDALMVHMTVGHPDRRFHCDICGFAFKQRAHLKTHVEVRHLKKRYSCHTCGQDFTTTGTLKRHVASVHQKKRDSQCTMCPWRFTQKSDMRRHILTVHQKSRPNSCNLCDARFSQVWDLKRHLRCVHNLGGGDEAADAPSESLKDESMSP